MSIFKESFKPEIRAQLEARQAAIQKRDATAITYFNARTAWVKMTSAVNVNGSSDLAQDYVLLGGVLFGSSQPKSGVGTGTENAYSTTTGREKHRLGMRPMPGITGIDVKTKSAYGSLMEATVNFVCWDIKQLEELELLYMRPNYSVLLEWGWIPYLTNSGGLGSTIDFNTTVLAGGPTKEAIWKDLYNKSLNSGGNYHGLYGFVKNYSWSARPDGGYDCSTTLITMGEIIESLKINHVLANTNSAEKGVFGKADAENFKKDGPLNKAYQRSYLAGILYEMYITLKDVGKIESKAGQSLLGYNFYCYEFKSEGDTSSTSTEGGDKPETFVSEPKNIYIKLKDFIAVLNKYILLSDGTSPIVEISLTEGFQHSKPNDPLLCLGHPYQISMDPTICLIKNTLFKNSITTSSSSAGGDAGAASEAGNTANEVIAGIPESDEFLKPPKDNGYYGVIENIYVNLAYLYTLITDDGLASQDKSEKKDINLFDFIKNMMSGINASIGNNSNFDIHVDPTDSIARIIDVNYVDERTKADAYANAFLLEMHNTRSTVRSYKLESQIFPEQSSVVAIGAQAKGGALGQGDNTLIDFNQNLEDRIVKKKELPPSVPTPDDGSQLENLKTNLTTIAEYFSSLDDGNSITRFFGGGATFDKAKASQYTNALKDIISYTKVLTADKNNNTAIIPTKLSIEMDGIGGIIIGSMFKIPGDLLPRGYKGGDVGALIGYLVTSVAHSIGSDNDWKTTLGAQFIILDGTAAKSKSLKSISDAIATKAREVERVKKIPPSPKAPAGPPSAPTNDGSDKVPTYVPGTNTGNVKNYNKNNSGKQTPNSIVLHCTAGYGSALSTVNFVNEKLSIHYAVDREGNVVQGMDENLIGWHANNKNPGSIGIEIGNIFSGYENSRGVIVTDATKSPLAKGTGTVMEDIGFSWNGRRYFEQYSDVQINALETLLRGILKRNPGIKLNYTKDLSSIYKNVFGFPGIPEAGKSYFPQKPNGGKGATKDDAGIFTHVICSGSGHGDPPPTNKIINMLQRLLSPPAPPPPPPPPPVNAKGVAAQLFDALNRYDTDEDNIKAQLNRLSNQNDWSNTIAAYGTRTIDAGINYTANLKTTLSKELNSDELKEIKSLLAKKGITY